jgi:hypothetical protein
MTNTIEENSFKILQALAQLPRGNYSLTGPELNKLVDLSPDEINDASKILYKSGHIIWLRWMGTGPYLFGNINITPKGRNYLEQTHKINTEHNNKSNILNKYLDPVGSPYGFIDSDWKIVSTRKADRNKIYVVFGSQFKSKFYNTQNLISNIHDHFKLAINTYNNDIKNNKIELSFKALQAGYGNHLFNEIARDIISSDIAVFDTSNLNPNVMLELGVALTWGVSVLPIKKEGCKKPPSDISGQTWADYLNDGVDFVDTDHNQKLLNLITRVVERK